jgi:facilitated trehalose transporter
MPIIFAACFLWMPETPQYLLMRGKEEQAEESLQYFRGKNVDVKNELAKLKEDVDQQMKNKACAHKTLFIRKFS